MIRARFELHTPDRRRPFTRELEVLRRPMKYAATLLRPGDYHLARIRIRDDAGLLTLGIEPLQHVMLVLGCHAIAPLLAGRAFTFMSFMCARDTLLEPISEHTRITLHDGTSAQYPTGALLREMHLLGCRYLTLLGMLGGGHELTRQCFQPQADEARRLLEERGLLAELGRDGSPRGA